MAIQTTGAILCEPHVGQAELVSANAMHQFDPGDRNGGVPEAFEAEHDVHPRFDVAMIPVDPVFRYLDDFGAISSGRSPSTFISRAARWDAA